MTRGDEKADLTPLARVICDTIDSYRAEFRLYPEIYAEKVAEAVLAFQAEEGVESEHEQD